jgi:hypothetical protein
MRLCVGARQPPSDAKPIAGAKGVGAARGIGAVIFVQNLSSPKSAFAEICLRRNLSSPKSAFAEICLRRNPSSPKSAFAEIHLRQDHLRKDRPSQALRSDTRQVARERGFAIVAWSRPSSV